MLMVGFVGGISSVNATSSSIGVSPSQISNNLLVPGAELDTTLTVSRASAVDEVTAKIESFGDGVTSWISFPQGNTVILAKGVQRVEMIVKIKVPTDAKIGKYVGNLRLTLVKEEKGQINIVPGVRVDVNLEVTDAKTESLTVQYVRITDSAFGAPYSLIVKINNTGNIATSPDTLVLTVFDIAEKQLRQLTYTFAEKVEPFQSKEFQVQMPDATPLPLGEYLGTVTIAKGSKTVFTERLTFRVVAALPSISVTSEAKAQKSSNVILAMIVGFVVLLVLGGVAVIFYVFFKRDGQKRTSDT